MLFTFLSMLCLKFINVADGHGQRSDTSSQIRLKCEKKMDSLEIEGYQERAVFINMLLLWSILCPVYTKCLDQYLRNERIALIVRSRYAYVTWSIVFNSISIFYMSIVWNASVKENLIEVVVKSYYIHYGGIIIFVNKNWCQGLLHFFMTLSVFGIHNKNLQTKAFEIYIVHAIHILLMDIYRLGYLKYYSTNKKFQREHPRFPYLYYFLVWSFLCLSHSLLHVISAPFNHLLLRHEELFFPAVLIELRLIFLFLMLLKNVIYPQSWKLWLFSNPSLESLHLKTIINNFRVRRETAEKTSLKKQIWQTLVCTMVIKKKLNRMKKSKQVKAENSN